MVRPVRRGRGRGRPPKYDPDDLPEFFKIYLPELNSKQLLIPPDFVKDFLRRTPKRLTLKNKEFKGKVWNVELQKAENNLHMKKGWESFVIDNSLERGEFLTFSYCENAVFTVKIFSISGCKRNNNLVTSMLTSDQPCVKVKQEPDMVETYSHRTHDDEKTNIESELMLVEPEKQDLLVVTRGVPDETIEPKGMRFTKVISKLPYELHIPASIYTLNNIYRPRARISKMILLRNRNGDSHRAKLLHRHDRVVLTTGWKECQAKNKLVEGDECEFEVIFGEDRTIKEILLLQIRRRKTARTRKAHSRHRPRNK